MRTLKDFNVGDVVYRHGDVLVKLSDKEVDGPEAVEALLHKGQNHHHTLKRGLFVMKDVDGVTYLTVKKETLLDHEEHGPITLLPGAYYKDIQLERDHWLEESREVID